MSEVNKMYCPRCGSGNQEPESYCRNCGDYLLDYSGRSFLINRMLGGSTPSTQVTVNLGLNLVTILTSVLLLGFLNGYYDSLEARTGQTTPPVIYLVYVFLVVISLWQILSLIVGARLRAKLDRKRKEDGSFTTSRLEPFAANETRELLPEGEGHDTVPVSVTEESTRILDKVPRK